MLAPFILLASAPLAALAGDVLQTNGFSSCLDGPSDIVVNKLDIKFDRSIKKVVFDVSGTNEKSQKVMATLTVAAYGRNVYNRTFNPCDGDVKVDQLCPGSYILSLLIPMSNTMLTPFSSLWHLQRKG